MTKEKKLGNQELCKEIYYDLENTIQKMKKLPCDKNNKEQVEETLRVLSDTKDYYKEAYYRMLQAGRKVDLDFAKKLSKEDMIAFLERYKGIKFFYRSELMKMVDMFFQDNPLAVLEMLSPENYKELMNPNKEDVLCYWDKKNNLIIPHGIVDVLYEEGQKDSNGMYRAVLTDKEVVEKLGYDEKEVEKLLNDLYLFNTTPVDTVEETIESK